MRRLSALVLAAALAVGLAACADPDATAAAPPAVDDTCPQASVPLTELDLVDDVRTATGPATACLASHAITPVDDRTAPQLPVTVTDSEGRTVEVTDVDRILPIDISGTIASTVFALGLGDQVVGRDSSTLFPGTEELPVVTKTGHTLNPEAILGLAPPSFSPTPRSARRKSASSSGTPGSRSSSSRATVASTPPMRSSPRSPPRSGCPAAAPS